MNCSNFSLSGRIQLCAVVKVLAIILTISLLLAWISSGFKHIDGWAPFFAISMLAAAIFYLTWRLLDNEDLPQRLSTLVLLAILVRLSVGAFWYIALPMWGHGTPAEKAGYVMADSSARDQTAWELAQSDKPLFSAFQNNRKVDQYGGFLFLSALIYRYLGGNSHLPLLIVVVTAVFSSLAVLFTWALSRHAWGEAIAWLAAWILVLYPEAILLGSSQMREAITIALTAAAFYGLLRYFHDRSWISLLWILTPLLFFLPFSPPFAALLTIILAITAISTIAATKRDVFQQRRLLLILGILSILVLAGLWFALRQFTPPGMYNPLEMLSWWLRKSASLQAYLSQHGSGWMQKIFKSVPEWTHLPLLLAYGIVQPFLPAAVIARSQAPLWEWIAIWRALGWTFLLLFLVYAPFRVFRKIDDGAMVRVFVVIVWIVIIVAAFRGGSDMWDNPRYRATFASLQVALVAWVWSAQRRNPDPWLRRAFVGLVIILTWFVPWYLYRYYSFPWPVKNFFLTLGCGIATASIIIFLDWQRASRNPIKQPDEPNV